MKNEAFCRIIQCTMLLLVVILPTACHYSAPEECQGPIPIRTMAPGSENYAAAFALDGPGIPAAWPPAGQESTAPSEQQQEGWVWVSPHGKRHHRSARCSNMKEPIQMPLAEAIPPA